MHVSPSGRAFLEAEEGFKPRAYADIRGIPTIGYGHTGPDVTTQDVERGLTWTRAECDAALAADLRRTESAIVSGLRIPPTQNQFDALASLVYNIGVPGFYTSTVRRLYNLNNLSGSADAFLMWRNAGPHKGVLLGRRMRERALFLKA
jgi:lysozyme